MMIYKLQGYMYKNHKIYKRTWKFFYKCINKGPYSFDVGVKKINQLCGIFEESEQLKINTTKIRIDSLIREYLKKMQKCCISW